MSENDSTARETRKKSEKEMARRLGAAGWGLFFIWSGASLAMDLGWGTGLVGVGAIILLTQAARRFCDLQLEGFWVVVGAMFVLGGLWELSAVDVDPVPLLLILAGTMMLLSMFRRRSSSSWRPWCRGEQSRKAGGWRCCSWSTDGR